MFTEWSMFTEWAWIAPQEVADALDVDVWRSKIFATKEDAIASGIGNIGWTLQCRQVTPWETCGVMREVEIRNKIMSTSQGGPWQTMGEVVPNPPSLRIDEPIKETGDE